MNYCGHVSMYGMPPGEISIRQPDSGYQSIAAEAIDDQFYFTGVTDSVKHELDFQGRCWRSVR